MALQVLMKVNNLALALRVLRMTVLSLRQIVLVLPERCSLVPDTRQLDDKLCNTTAYCVAMFNT